MSTHAASSSRASATFPAFEGEPHYIEGYVPVSYASPHSALERGSTWMGMGFILSSVVGIGTISFALGSRTSVVPGAPVTGGTQEHWLFLFIFGVCFALACWIIGGGLIRYGRSGYRAYRARTGRVS